MKMNWREYPFVRLLLPLASGILLAFQAASLFAFLHTLLPLLLALLMMLLIVRRRQPYRLRWLFGLLTGVFFLVLGYQLTYWHDDWRRPDHFHGHLAGSEQMAAGRILSRQDKGERWEARLELTGITDTTDRWRHCRGRLLLYLPKDTPSDLPAGSRILFRARIRRIEPPDNPAAFDFARYMRVQNIYFQAFPRADAWQLLPRPDRERRLSDWMARRQSQGVAVLRSYLADDAAFGVGSALILGRRDGLDADTKAAYSQTGAMHVLAVSGLHVGLIALLLNLLLRGIWIKRRWATWLKLLLQIAGIWGFALLTGGSPSVLRAACMFSMLLLGIHLRRYSNIYNTLAASAFLLLCARPFMLMEVGFQLSYLAVLGIVYFQPKLYRLWRVRTATGRWLWKLTCVSLAAQLTTLPVSLYYFHQFPVYFWLSGLVVVPAAMIILPLGLTLIAVHTLPVLPDLLGQALLWIIEGVNFAIHSLQQLPGHLINGIWITGPVLLLLYLLLAAVVLRIETNRPYWTNLALCIALLIGLQYNWRQWNAVQQRRVVFYRIYNHTALDFIDGQKSYTLIDRDLPPEKLDRASQYFRWSAGVRQSEVLQLEADPTTTDNWMHQPGFVQFHDLRLAVLDRPVTGAGQPIDIDYLLIRDNPRLDITTTLHQFRPRHLVFDASNHPRSVERWKQACRDLSLPCYDLNEHGALVIDLKQNH